MSSPAANLELASGKDKIALYGACVVIQII